MNHRERLSMFALVSDVQARFVFFYLTFHKMKISIPSTYGLLFNKTKNCYETN